MIEVNNLHKSFVSKKNTVKALDGLSFTAKDGEITGILGPNGAGKPLVYAHSMAYYVLMKVTPLLTVLKSLKNRLKRENY